MADNKENTIKQNRFSRLHTLIPIRLSSLGKTAVTFLSRLVLSSILIGLSYVSSFTSSVVIVLRITAFLLGVINIVIGIIRLIINRQHFYKPAVFLVVATAAAITGSFLSAVAAAFIYDGGTMLFSVFFRKKSEPLNHYIDSFASKENVIGKKAERLNNLRDDINGFHFNEALFISKLIYIASCSILAVAVALCIIPPLFDGMSFGKWIGRAVCVAAAGTVCELTGISILTCISGILDAFQNKIYFRSIDLFFFSASITSVLFNKTGIITTGEFEVSGIYPVRISEDELLFLASYAEAYSSHPLAGAILRYSGINVDKERILRRKEELGMGSVIQLVGSQIIAAGNIEFMEKLGVSGNFSPSGTTSVYIAVNKIYVGRIDFLDNIRHDAESTVQKLKKLGVANIAIMTGDSTTVATKVGRQIGISEIYADYQPQDKVNRMQYILDTQEPDDKLANIGDGVHDAELLALSDIGVVLGNDDGSVDADVIIDSHELSFIPEMIRIPQKVRKTLKLDSAAALLADILIVILSICGIMPLWSVILTQFAVQLLLCLNINN